MELIESDVQGWVRELHVDKFLQTFNRRVDSYYWVTLEDHELRHYAMILRAIPATHPSGKDHDYGLTSALTNYADDMSEERKAILRDLVRCFLPPADSKIVRDPYDANDSYSYSPAWKTWTRSDELKVPSRFASPGAYDPTGPDGACHLEIASLIRTANPS
jgi:hypothetical protein